MPSSATATTEIYTLSLHDALPISTGPGCASTRPRPVRWSPRRRASAIRAACRLAPAPAAGSPRTPRTRSPLAALFGEEVQNVSLGLEGRRQTDIARPRGPRPGFAHHQARRIPGHRLQPGHRRVTIEHGDRLAPSHPAQVLAQPALQFGNPDGVLHDHMIVTYGQISQPQARRAAKNSRINSAHASASTPPLTSTR